MPSLHVTICSTFENVVLFCNKYTELIPLTFVLGFYVALVVKRWWEKFQQIPWIDKFNWAAVTINIEIYITCLIAGWQSTLPPISLAMIRKDGC